MTEIPANLLNTITTGDARELARALPDGSVDLIFTDPIYSERPLYDWLAIEAQRLLKPGGAVLVWSNGKWHRENANWLEAGGLRYRWDFGCVIATGPAPMNGYVIAKTNRIIWLDRNGESKMRGYLADGYTSVTMTRLYSEFTWTKNPIFMRQALEAFSRPGDLVFDPFCGEGTTPAVAKIANRRFVAFELIHERAERARQRVDATQAMHPAFTAEQEVMALE